MGKDIHATNGKLPKLTDKDNHKIKTKKTKKKKKVYLKTTKPSMIQN